MKNILLVVGLVLAMAVGSTKSAEACGGGGSGNYDGLVAGILVVGGTYAGVTLGMGIKDISSDDHSVGYGVAEALVHTPIALLWGAGTLADAQNSGSVEPGFVIMTALHTALAAHGIYTIAKSRPSKRDDRQRMQQRPYQGPPGTFQVGRVTASVTPAPMQNGAGLGFAGSF